MEAMDVPRNRDDVVDEHRHAEDLDRMKAFLHDGMPSQQLYIALAAFAKRSGVP